MKIKCNFCNGKCIKNGFQSNGNQRYKCCVCQRREQIDYSYNAYKRDINQGDSVVHKRRTRNKKYRKNTKNICYDILKIIISIARSITKPIISTGKTYKIFTDRLKNYRYLIDEKVHSVKRFGTNHIERKNLTLRTHLKRLNRRTICYSKSLVVLIAILKIYFWF